MILIDRARARARARVIIIPYYYYTIVEHLQGVVMNFFACPMEILLATPLLSVVKRNLVDIVAEASTKHLPQ